ncbi:DUF3999 family protein [Ramlibacter terrae]|uniref:DUF3999 family protein n=1 Tax=Ramlibacter terrae TaxID=2732511 RepID=A0ABX6P0R8_9BURK|nr:DUF3999 family protein [Ramlibacter terrae]
MRLPVPAEALARLQSPAAADLRVFGAKGQPVPFALAAPPQAPEAPRVPTRRCRRCPCSPPPALRRRGARCASG